MCNQPGHGVRDASEALVRVYQSIGAEHEALSGLESAVSATPRRVGTVRRMRQNITDASRQVGHVLRLLATAHGMDALGLDGRLARNGAGDNYRALAAAGNPEACLVEAVQLVLVVVRSLSTAYEPTQGHPELAVARRPKEMAVVFGGLRDAMAALNAEFIARGHGEDATELAACGAFVEELQARVCGFIPEQAVRLTADEVCAAILADPAIARAAESALARATV